MISTSDFNSKLLTIAIPTYNRSTYLKRLLDSLKIEISGFEDLVDIVVSDNASTDDTSSVLDLYTTLIPCLSIIRHAKNFGMDVNFITCATNSSSQYFWLVGDDDLPRPGSIGAILEILKSEAPDLVYLQSRSIAHSTLKHGLSTFSDVEFHHMSRDGFAKIVNVWFTYLSGNIVKATEILKDREALAKYQGSNLAQLSWTFDRLKNGSCFVFVATPLVFSQPANTGGYSVLNVFLRQFPQILEAELDKKNHSGLRRALMFRIYLGYYPSLVLSARLNLLGSFSSEKIVDILKFRTLSDLPGSTLLFIVAKAPIPISRFVVRCASLAARFISWWDKYVDHIYI